VRNLSPALSRFLSQARLPGLSDAVIPLQRMNKNSSATSMEWIRARLRRFSLFLEDQGAEDISIAEHDDASEAWLECNPEALA
jgi:hypothetical protein